MVLEPESVDSHFLALGQLAKCTRKAFDEKQLAISEPTKSDRELLSHAEVYALADKYNVPGLKARAANKFAESLADMLPGKALYKTAKMVYESTPENDVCLRRMFASKTSDFLERYGMLKYIQRCVDGIPGLAQMVLRVKYEKPKTPGTSGDETILANEAEVST